MIDLKYTADDPSIDLQWSINHVEDRMRGVPCVAEYVRSMAGDSNTDPFQVCRRVNVLRDGIDELEQFLAIHADSRMVAFTDDQKHQKRSIRGNISAVRRLLDNSHNVAIRRIDGKTIRDMRQLPPQYAFLTRAVVELENMVNGDDNHDLAPSLDALRTARDRRSLPVALAVLDNLRRNGLDLTDKMESTRKTIRCILGMSPMGPVCLQDAIADAGWRLPDDRQSNALVKAIDNGLREHTGGQGEEYESVVTLVARSMADARVDVAFHTD